MSATTRTSHKTSNFPYTLCSCTASYSNIFSLALWLMVVACSLITQAVRTSAEATNPVYVSVGHKISLETAVQLVLACSFKRVPEPVRQVCVCVCVCVFVVIRSCVTYSHKVDLLSRTYLRKEKRTKK